MPGRSDWTGERRDTLDELDPALRDRLLRLDEPVDWSDWDAVVARAARPERRARPARPGRRSLALVAAGAAALSAACTLGLVLLLGGGRPAPGAAPLRLQLHLGDGSGLVLYSVPAQARFLDKDDNRLAGQAADRSARGVRQSAAIERFLSGGPFRVPAAVIRAARTAPGPGAGPLPGDEAVVALRVYTRAGQGTAAGSAVFTCHYDFNRNATCDGALSLEDGVHLTVSGVLDAGANDLTLEVTGGSGGAGAGNGLLA